LILKESVLYGTDAERRIDNVGRLLWGSGGRAPSRRRQGGLFCCPLRLAIFAIF